MSVVQVSQPASMELLEFRRAVLPNEKARRCVLEARKQVRRGDHLIASSLLATHRSGMGIEAEQPGVATDSGRGIACQVRVEGNSIVHRKRGEGLM